MVGLYGSLAFGVGVRESFIISKYMIVYSNIIVRKDLS